MFPVRLCWGPRRPRPLSSSSHELSLLAGYIGLWDIADTDSYLFIRDQGVNAGTPSPFQLAIASTRAVVQKIAECCYPQPISHLPGQGIAICEHYTHLHA